MKSATQPGVTSAPLVLPTNPKHPFAKLIIRGELGQVVQQWLVLQNKCTIGSASNCAIRCELPGIAAYHALLVIGAKQTFIRALAPKLTRGGESVNELLLTESENEFEIAGHKFELLRNAKSTQRPTASRPSSTRLKFTLARPFELNRPRPLAETEPAASQQESIQDFATTNEMNAQWIADLIQSAVQPLEHQIHSMLEPLNAVKLELSKKKEDRPPKRRRLPKISRQMLKSKESMVAKVPKQSSSLPIVSRPPSPISADSPANQIAQTPVQSPVPEVERPLPAALEVLFAKQAASLDILSERLGDMNSQLSSLERIVAENISSTNANLPAPTPSNQDSIDRLQATTDRLSELLLDLQSRQSESEKSDGTWREEIRQQILDMQSEMRRPIVVTTPEVQSQSSSLDIAGTKSNLTTASVVAPAINDLPAAAPIQDQIKSQLAPVVQAPVVQAPVVQAPAVQAPVHTSVSSERVQQTSAASEFTMQPSVAQTLVPKQTPPSPETTPPTGDLPIAKQQYHTEAETAFNSQFGFGSEPAFSDSLDAAPSPGDYDSANFAPWLQDELIDSVPSVGSTSVSEQVVIEPVVSEPAVIEQLVAAQPASDYAWHVDPVAPPSSMETSESIAVEEAKVNVEWGTEEDAGSKFGFGSDDGFQASDSLPSTSALNVPPNLELPVRSRADDEWGTSASASSLEPAMNREPDTFASAFAKQSDSAPDLESVADSEPLNSWSAQFESSALSESAETDQTPEIQPHFASELESYSIAKPLQQPTQAEQAQPIEASSTSLPSWWTEDDSDVGAASGINAGVPVHQPFGTGTLDTGALEAGTLNSGTATTAGIDSVASEREQLETSFAESTHAVPSNEYFEPDAEEQVDDEEAERLSSLFQMFGIGGAATDSQPMADEQVAEPETGRAVGNIAHTNYAPFAAASPVDREERSFEVTSNISADESSTSYGDTNGEVGAGSDLTSAAAERARAALALTPYEIPQPIDDELEESPTANESAESDFASESKVREAHNVGASVTDEEESIEDYMTRLLARMRGNEEAPASSSSSMASGVRKAPARSEASSGASGVTGGASRTGESSQTGTSSQLLQQPETRRGSQTITAPFNPEEYIPRALAPEKSKNLAAMRELANTSARSAIQVSARRKYGTALVMKLVVASIGFGVGCTLIMINGLNLNIGLIATVASFLVAIIWGFDAVSTIKPILNAGSEKEQAALAAAKEAAGEVE